MIKELKGMSLGEWRRQHMKDINKMFARVKGIQTWP